MSSSQRPPINKTSADTSSSSSPTAASPQSASHLTPARLARGSSESDRSTTAGLMGSLVTDTPSAATSSRNPFTIIDMDDIDVAVSSPKAPTNYLNECRRLNDALLQAKESYRSYLGDTPGEAERYAANIQRFIEKLDKSTQNMQDKTLPIEIIKAAYEIKKHFISLQPLGADAASFREAANLVIPIMNNMMEVVRATFNMQNTQDSKLKSIFQNLDAAQLQPSPKPSSASSSVTPLNPSVGSAQSTGQQAFPTPKKPGGWV